MKAGVLFALLRDKPAFFLRRSFLWAGALAGALIGIPGGLAGICTGFIIGLLLQELFRQLRNDASVADYLENPGASRFYEAEPGLAAYCALACIIAAASLSAEERRRFIAGGILAEAVLERAGGNAAQAFSGTKYEHIESFCRLAASRYFRLNPDLLTESLAARRRKHGDLHLLGRTLHSLASGGEAMKKAARIRAVLDPGYRVFEGQLNAAIEKLRPDPWRKLGLTPAASLDEIKSMYRRLAIQFHPDGFSSLDEKQRLKAEQAFIKIKEAYLEILSEKQRLS